MSKKQLLSRLLQIVVVLVGISFITFLLTYLSPGDPVENMYISMGQMPSEEIVEQTREEMGLNDPFLTQYVRWLGNCLHGDFGTSYSLRQPVTELLLERMRLPDGDHVMRSYPFQLSGGMRQRVGIAMGMTYQPKLLLADEPTSALDVTTQAQIVRQMMELRAEYHTGIILVTHNIGVAAYMADHIVVMRNGRIEDQGDREQILHASRNPYTRKLIASVPSMGGEWLEH